LVLIVGSTGSGKSTSLAAMIGHRNQTLKGHIVTIEDPIEFVHDHGCSIITQREIGIDTNSFAAALKSSLRQAPDVISIGEIRDAEVLRAALAFAETGHLCLATLHSNNASKAIERILSFCSVEQHQQVLTQLSMTLRAVISQRLVLSKLNSRVAAVEVLLDTPRIKDLISRGRIDEIKEAMEKGARDGMQTFDQHLYELFYSGVISFDEALKNADSANNLRVRARLADADPLSGSQVDELESAISAGLAISKNS
jgi:twitching motility protein PilU